MAQEHSLDINTHENIYKDISSSGYGYNRKAAVYFSLPDKGVNSDTGLLLLIAGFSGEANSNVHKKMRNYFADKYNLITVQCDYFGYQFMQDPIITRKNYPYLFSTLLKEFNQEDLKAIFCNEQFNIRTLFTIADKKNISNNFVFHLPTPEYNRSVPPVLKNAIDVASRPYGQNLWDGKPGAIVSVSTGKISGFGANHHLRQSMAFLNVFMLQQPEAYVGNVDSILDSDGKISDEGSKKFLQSIADAFAQWVKKFV